MSYHTDRHPDRGDLGTITGYDTGLGTRHTELESTVSVLAAALESLDADAWTGSRARRALSPDSRTRWIAAAGFCLRSRVPTVFTLTLSPR